jgi:peptidyl-tRNA hydrolase
MSAGKAAAQAVHAVMTLGVSLKGFSDTHKRTVIILEADNEQQLRNLDEYLDGASIYSDYYIDEGMNEVAPYSITALAVEPIASDDEDKRAIFEQFSLFRGESDDYTEAYEHLSIACRGFRDYDYASMGNHTPRHIKKTLKWLKDRIIT